MLYSAQAESYGYKLCFSLYIAPAAPQKPPRSLLFLDDSEGWFH
jgi:hypothetical protein